MVHCWRWSCIVLAHPDTRHSSLMPFQHCQHTVTSIQNTLHNCSFSWSALTCKVVPVTVCQAGCLLPPERFLVLISVTGWVDTRAIVRLEGLGKLKNPMTSSGIEPMSLLIQDSEFSTNLQCTDSQHILYNDREHCSSLSVYVKMVMVTGKKFTLVIVTILTECYTEPPYKDWTAVFPLVPLQTS
jgi:hypothetical protein